MFYSGQMDCEKGGLNLLKTEEAIFFIKEKFQKYLAEALNLIRVSAPLFVSKDSGIQDNLNGVEKPVTFNVPAIEKENFEVIQSLAKWKRYALARYEIPVGKGIYTDMNALRPDEESLITGIHSIYVDQWDWERVISPEERNLETLYRTVNNIYKVLKKVEEDVAMIYGIEQILPDEITFLHTEELALKYPDLSPKEREYTTCKEFKAVFLTGVGNELHDGTIHDGRAPDYDDWTTPNSNGRRGLNGDIFLWNSVLENAFEISSMGIRVDKDAMIRQLEIRGCMERKSLPWHQMLISGQLPQSIGGGIGQSRLCMFLLRKRHIGEVQVSVWPDSVIADCKEQGIILL